MFRQNRIIKHVVLIALTIVIFPAVIYGDTGDGKKHLMEVQTLLANSINDNYEIKEVVEKATSGYDFLPDIVKKINYYNEKESKHPSRIDYFERRRLSADKFIARQYFFFRNDEISYEVWVDEDNNLIKFVYISPAAIIGEEENITDRKIEYYYYDNKGNLTKKWISIVHLNHQKMEATFTDMVYDGQGNILSEKSGDAVYEEFICPDSDRICWH